MTSRTDTHLPDGQLRPTQTSTPTTRNVSTGQCICGGGTSVSSHSAAPSVPPHATDSSTAFPAQQEVSWAIFWINIAGALLLGVLPEHTRASRT
ncbi:hypothetical protein QP157_21105 [Sphingomonas sp. LR61]|uniref:hypothetical protein n=1 Tax=Sphingomonas sp. LR61 TaxID=3050234 RepID=UPI002FE1240B